MISAKIIEDSVSAAGIRITTMSLVYPRFIHAEFMTHRIFSRNASSSRAEPVLKHIERIEKEPAMPIYWGSNQPGMQAGDEVADIEYAKALWSVAKDHAVKMARKLHDQGLHKQIVNRVLEPFSHINVVVTSTEWENFFNLRCHKDAQPEIKDLADKMRLEKARSAPRMVEVGNWHLPYVKREERYKYDLNTLLAASTARCARVSYLKHDGAEPQIEEDIKLFERLCGGVPIHASPTEHQATPLEDKYDRSNNFTGWLQHRELLDNASQKIDVDSLPKF